MKKLFISLMMLLALPMAALAQVNPAWTTTLSSAITETQQVIPLTAVTNSAQAALGAVTPLAKGMGLYIDGEYMIVASSYVSGTQVPVVRGQLGTVARAHVTSSTVLIGPAAVFDVADPGYGSSVCPAAPSPYLVAVNVVSGNVWLCRFISGFTGQRVWWATNSRGITYNSLTVR